MLSLSKSEEGNYVVEAKNSKQPPPTWVFSICEDFRAKFPSQPRHCFALNSESWRQLARLPLIWIIDFRSTYAVMAPKAAMALQQLIQLEQFLLFLSTFYLFQVFCQHFAKVLDGLPFFLFLSGGMHYIALGGHWFSSQRVEPGKHTLCTIIMTWRFSVK